MACLDFGAFPDLTEAVHKLRIEGASLEGKEIFDLFGVTYEGHPNLTKILTPDFLQGHPLRKDYAHIKDRYDE